jgi:glucose-6-phosphate isomerase
MHASDPWIKGAHLKLNRQRQWQSPALDPATGLLKQPEIYAALSQFRADFFGAKKINRSEDRAAGHWALRTSGLEGPSSALPSQFSPNGQDLIPRMSAEHQRTRLLADSIRTGAYKTTSGLSCTDIIHLGIGGSDTGPHLLIEALGPISGGLTLRAHFVPNIDGHALASCIARLDPTRTLIVLASKSFGTLETLTNAEVCRAWMASAGIAQPKENFIAVTAYPDKAVAWGIGADRILWFDESIGGRYSIWGPVSITARTVLGNPMIDDFLKGGVAMDTHFAQAKNEENLPILLALTDAHNLHRRGIPSLMVSAYDSRLHLLLPYLNQLWMESLGKGVDQAGKPLQAPAAPILWGDVGTNAQHSFFQLLHQAAIPVAIDLIGVQYPDHPFSENHRSLLANLIAQAQALAVGRPDPDPQKSCPGGHPVNLLMLERCDGENLGALVALWEYRVMCLAAIQHINPFDQWGVALGKSIAQAATAALGETPAPSQSETLDAISQAIIDSLKR